MSTKISKLPEIRKLNETSRKDEKVMTMSTHEQLRSIHIETLEQLQVSTETNNSLRHDLNILKSIASSNKGDQICDALIDPENDTAGDTVLLNKIQDQEQEIKALKFRVCQADGELRDTKEKSKLLRQQEFESRKKLEKELLEQGAATSKCLKASVATLTSDNLSLESTLKDKENIIKLLESSRAADERNYQLLQEQLLLLEEKLVEHRELAALSHSNQQSLSDSVSQMKSERDTAISQILGSEIKHDSLMSTLTTLQREQEGLISKMSANQKEIQTLHFDVSKLKAEILSLRSENLKLKADCEKSNSKLSAFIATHSVTLPVSILVPPSVVSVIESARGGDYSIGGKGYEELTNLRKENKALRLQIARVQNQKSVSIGSTKSVGSSKA